MNLKDNLSNPIFKTIGDIADSMGREVYVVGGFVRAIFLGRPSKDFDFVPVGSGIALAKMWRRLWEARHISRYSQTMALPR